ncbi:MAG: sugar phosphate nucleotidyltransferase [Actinomycetota bacterium]|nr:sugar phosphate nucleotidyltransferase [Actinomycetota bacterium]
MSDGPVVILCGGRGVRLREHTESIPKPLVEIGGMPVVWHVIRIYAAQGFDRFVLATGYMGELVDEFARTTPWPDGVQVACFDTGLETPTGGRLLRLRDELGDAPFCVTYADGVADVDLSALLAHHRDSGALGTMTVVRPQMPFGVVRLGDEADGDRVTGFEEKPRSEHWINGGFFCFERGVFDYLNDASVLERDPLERLALDGRLRAFRHTGFWDCMDTHKDVVALNDLWEQRAAPWRIWPG